MTSVSEDPRTVLDKLVASKESEKNEALANLKKMGEDDCNGGHGDAAVVYTQKIFYCDQVATLEGVIEVAKRMLRQLNSEKAKVTCLDCGETQNPWEMIAALWRNNIPVHRGCRFGPGRRC